MSVWAPSIWVKEWDMQLRFGIWDMGYKFEWWILSFELGANQTPLK